MEWAPAGSCSEFRLFTEWCVCVKYHLQGKSLANRVWELVEECFSLSLWQTIQRNLLYFLQKVYRSIKPQLPIKETSITPSSFDFTSSHFTFLTPSLLIREVISQINYLICFGGWVLCGESSKGEEAGTQVASIQCFNCPLEPLHSPLDSLH